MTVPSTPGVTDVGERSSPRCRRAVLGCILAAAVTVLDLALTSTALGSMLQSVGAPLDEGALVISASASAELVTLALSAYATRIVPPRRYLTLLVLLFAAGSLLTAGAWSLESLLMARVLQGAASGAIMPFAYYAIVVMLPRREHPAAISVFSTAVTATYVLGPLLSITLAEWLTWRALYWVALPAGLVALALALPGLRDVPEADRERGRRVSAVSIGGVVVGLFLLQYTLDTGGERGWFGSIWVWLTAVAAVASLGLFVRNELRTRSPLVDLRLLRPSAFSLSCGYNVVAGAAVYSSYFLIPFTLTGLGFSVAEIGAVSVYGAAVQLVVSLFLPVLLRRVDAHLVSLLGAVVLAAGALVPLCAGPDPGRAEIIGALVARSVGAGLLLASLGLMVTRTLAPEQAPSGSLLFNMARSLGGAVGTSLCVAFLLLREAVHVDAPGDRSARAMALQDVFAVAVVALALLALVFLVAYVRQERGARVRARRPA